MLLIFSGCLFLSSCNYAKDKTAINEIGILKNAKIKNILIAENHDNGIESNLSYSAQKLFLTPENFSKRYKGISEDRFSTINNDYEIDKMNVANKIKIENIPILEYHSIGEYSKVQIDAQYLYVTPKDFENQLKYLKEMNYTPITYDEFKNIENIKNPIMITFDDGYEDNYTVAYPILKKYNFKATIFLITSKISEPNHLNTIEIQYMKDIIDFQCHTKTHPHLTDISEKQLIEELLDSKIDLERFLNKRITILAYPYGNYNQNVIEIVKRYYEYAFVADNQIKSSIIFQDNTDYEAKRIPIENKTSITSFRNILEESQHTS